MVGIIEWMGASLRDPSGRLSPTNWDRREKENDIVILQITCHGWRRCTSREGWHNQAAVVRAGRESAQLQN
jgi:hypothetical protein